MDGEIAGASIEDIDFREEVVREGVKDKFNTEFKDEEVIQMMKAPSIGKYYNRYIRDQYKMEGY